MKKTASLIFASAVTMLVAVSAFAYPQPSSKFAATVKGPVIILATADNFDWKPAPATTVKVPGRKTIAVGTGGLTVEQVKGANLPDGMDISTTAP